MRSDTALNLGWTFAEGFDPAWVAAPARLIGPAPSPLRGGTTGLWPRATGEAGAGRATAATGRFAPVAIDPSAE